MRSRRGTVRAPRARVLPVAGKRSLVKWKDLEVADTATIRGWWERWPDAGVAIVCGRGLLVVDVDGPVGRDSMRRLLEQPERTLPRTATVRTGRASGGHHMYFRADVAPTTAEALGPGIETRGHGGYAVAPPNPHATGTQYRWAVRAPIAPAPAWLLAELVKDTPAPPPARGSSSKCAVATYLEPHMEPRRFSSRLPAPSG
jgi:Bifunctional DNA primase/polymerase, N-terminal